MYLPLNWAAREPGCPVQQPRDLVRGTVILFLLMFPSIFLPGNIEILEDLFACDQSSSQYNIRYDFLRSTLNFLFFAHHFHVPPREVQLTARQSHLPPRQRAPPRTSAQTMLAKAKQICNECYGRRLGSASGRSFSVLKWDRLFCIIISPANSPFFSQTLRIPPSPKKPCAPRLLFVDFV